MGIFQVCVEVLMGEVEEDVDLCFVYDDVIEVQFVFGFGDYQNDGKYDVGLMCMIDYVGGFVVDEDWQ